jgi:ketose-bisphosphate aldolase
MLAISVTGATMPLATGRDLLSAAERGGYAVPGFNVSNLELALGVLDAAEARRAPVLLQFNPSNIQHFGGLALAGAVGRALAEQADVPVAVHLDHGPDVALLRAAVQAGFTSLMFDGSTFPLERNTRETREAYAVAAAAGVALEAELGHVGGREPGVLTSEGVLTEPRAAQDFVEQTRVDSLAVSVGTAHGLAGEIRLDLLHELRVATKGLPLVLHGGSGVRPGQLRDAVNAGIRKVNVSSELHAAFARALDRGPRGSDPRPALMEARAAVAEVAAQRIEQLGAALQAGA